MNAETEEAIREFFIDPETPPDEVKNKSLLYLLRRDIRTCYGLDPSIRDDQALFPAMMTIMAGIDLLSKFYVGSYKNKGVGKRFKKFCRDCFPLECGDAEALYQLRNSLVHSFGLLSEDEKTNVSYVFNLKKERTRPFIKLFLEEEKNIFFGEERNIKKTVFKEYSVSMDEFLAVFEEAIKGYRKKLDEDPTLQDNFEKVHPKYNNIYCGMSGLK